MTDRLRPAKSRETKVVRSPSGNSRTAKGVVYYLDAERHPRGVLLCNIFGRVDAARDLIRTQQPIEASTLSELVG